MTNYKERIKQPGYAQTPQFGSKVQYCSICCHEKRYIDENLSVCDYCRQITTDAMMLMKKFPGEWDLTADELGKYFPDVSYSQKVFRRMVDLSNSTPKDPLLKRRIINE